MGRASKLWSGLFLCSAALFFLISNRGAYQGYFQDDDLDNLTFTQEISGWDFAAPLLLPRYFQNNFRPVGHLFYRWMGQAAGLTFPPYIAAVHALHLVNVILLWFVLRGLGLPPIAAGAGALFFAFHMAAFDVYWKPMYVFDLLCGTFCLLSLLAYIKDHWIVSLAAFLIAYHAKEVAIMLPVVLLAYEFQLAQRRWKRLIPFFCVALCIAVQALIANLHRPAGDYTLRFDPGSIWQCLLFYSSKVFLLPYVGFIVLPLLLIRDRRVQFGIVSFCALVLPMLLLPGRLFSAYLYVALIGLAIAVGALAARRGLAVIALFFLIWLPWNYVNMRWFRRAALSDVADRRAFVQDLAEISRRRSDILTFVYDKGPVNAYGTHGALTILHPGRPVRFATLSEPAAADLLRSDALMVVDWDPRRRRLAPLVRSGNTPDASYIQIGQDTPIWQLESGWYPGEGRFRWTEPLATAHLRRPAEAKQFEILVNVGPLYIARVGRSHVSVSLNGQRIGAWDFTRQGWQTARWDLPPAPPGRVEVAIETSPPLRMPQVLGSAIAAFGFLPRENQ